MPAVFARYVGDDEVPALDFTRPSTKVVRDGPAPDPWRSDFQPGGDDRPIAPFQI
jgi:hypothetical protein